MNETKLAFNIFQKLNAKKEYIVGLLTVLASVVIFMSLFINRSLVPQEGWYSIYARNILEHGLVPYKDFFVIVPPLGLYSWTMIQFIFGDNFIVFHYAALISKIILSYCLFRTLTLITPIFFATIATICALCISISVVYDNGVLSYNEYAIIFALVIIILLHIMTKEIDKNRSFSCVKLIILGIVTSLSITTKQTSGIATTITAFSLLFFLTYKVTGFKYAIKSLTIALTSFIATTIFVLSPIIYYGAFAELIQATFGSHAAKGTSITSIFESVPRVLFQYNYIWPVVITGCFVIIYSAITIASGSVISINRSKKFSIKAYFIIFITFISVAIFAVLYMQGVFFKPDPVLGGAYLLKDQFVTISLYGAVAIALYLSLQVLFTKKLDINKYSLLMVLLILLANALSMAISAAMPNLYYYVFACVLGVALSANCKFALSKNVLLCGCALTIVFFSICMKLESPAAFHGWKSGNVLSDLRESFIPRLKGLKLPVEEVTMYEDFYTKVQQYTSPNDGILAFNNNQVFYDLLERPPFTQFVSLYYDVAPDSQAEFVLQKLRQEPPKAIVFLRFSEASQSFHEWFFRGGKLSGQRHLSHYIDRLIVSEQYKVVSFVTPGKNYDKKNMSFEAQNAMQTYSTNINEIYQLEDIVNELWQGHAHIRRQQEMGGLDNKLISPFSLAARADIENELAINYQKIDSLEKQNRKVNKNFKQYAEKQNSFIESGFTLMLLIRTDIFNSVH